MPYIFAFLLLITTVSYADEALPTSCKAVAINNEGLVLSKTPVLVMVHNSSDLDLWLLSSLSDHAFGESSHLQAGNWSALIASKEKIAVRCIESKPGHEQQISCKTVIAICEWPAVTLPKQGLNDELWAAENQHLAPLLEKLGGHGYEIPAGI